MSRSATCSAIAPACRTTAATTLEDLGFGRRQVLERLRLLPLAPFRISYAYTNFGFTAAAEAVAAASGKDFGDPERGRAVQAARHDTRPARALPISKRAPTAPSAHVKVGGGFEAKYQRQPDAQAPAGGVSSSVNDMARWLAMVTQGGSIEGRAFIDRRRCCRRCRRRRCRVRRRPSPRGPASTATASMSGVTPAGRMSFSHSGAFSLGAGTNLVILPSAGVGIVVLTNAAPIGAPEALAAEFMDLVQFGKIERDWFPPYQRPDERLQRTGRQPCRQAGPGEARSRPRTLPPMPERMRTIITARRR